MRATLAGLSLGLIAGFGAGPLIADEVWDSTFGPVAWEATMGEVAVLRLDVPESGEVVRMYVEGLGADVMGGRGAYRGVWISDQGDRACAVQVIGPDGAKSAYWGQFSISFVAPEFPSDWAGVFGNCLDRPETPVAALAVFAE
ncbi:hypothetical protein [Pararhodobacter oceanensis]|uniref:hypothetical protein n=1 Tax=Pararhodobacter oceanensis TaxID=2172121 RepID=UPI003A9244D2